MRCLDSPPCSHCQIASFICRKASRHVVHPNISTASNGDGFEWFRHGEVGNLATLGPSKVLPDGPVIHAQKQGGAKGHDLNLGLDCPSKSHGVRRNFKHRMLPSWVCGDMDHHWGADLQPPEGCQPVARRRRDGSQLQQHAKSSHGHHGDRKTTIYYLLDTLSTLNGQHSCTHIHAA